LDAGKSHAAWFSKNSEKKVINFEFDRVEALVGATVDALRNVSVAMLKVEKFQVRLMS